MIPFFKAAIFCFLMVYSMMPLTITSQKKTKKRTIEERLSGCPTAVVVGSVLVVLSSASACCWKCGGLAFDLWRRVDVQLSFSD